MRLQRTPQQRALDESLAERQHAGAVSVSDALIELRQRYGICATPACGRLVSYQCDGCGARLCDSCQMRHDERGCSPPQSVDVESPGAGALTARVAATAAATRDNSTQAMSAALTEIFARDPAPPDGEPGAPDSPELHAWRERVTPQVLDVAARFGVIEPRRAR